MVLRRVAAPTISLTWRRSSSVMRLAVLLLSAAFMLAGCSDSDSSGDSGDDGNQTVAPPPQPPGAPPMNTADVSLENNAFVPNEVNITVGGTVTWTHNDGNVPHNVEGDGFDSHPNCTTTTPVPLSQVCMVDGNTYDRTFDEAGDVEYLCEIHSGMTGVIHVLPA